MGESPLSDETIVKFKRAEKYLKSEGWVVENPADDCYQEALKEHVENYESRHHCKLTPQEKYEEMLLTDIIGLSECNAIYMLPDWKDSPGATAEYCYAKAVGKEIIMGNVKDVLDRDYDLVNLNVPFRLFRLLKCGHYNIDNLEEVTQYARTDFLKIRGFGIGSLKQLEKLMEENGFEFKK